MALLDIEGTFFGEIYALRRARQLTNSGDPKWKEGPIDALLSVLNCVLIDGALTHYYANLYGIGKGELENRKLRSEGHIECLGADFIKWSILPVGVEVAFITGLMPIKDDEIYLIDWADTGIGATISHPSHHLLIEGIQEIFWRA